MHTIFTLWPQQRVVPVLFLGLSVCAQVFARLCVTDLTLAQFTDTIHCSFLVSRASHQTELSAPPLHLSVATVYLAQWGV